MVLLKTFKTAPNLHNCHSQNIIQTLNLQTTFCNSPFLFYTILDLIFSTGKCSGVLFCKFTTWDFVYGGEILIANTHNGKHKHMERSSADYKLLVLCSALLVPQSVFTVRQKAPTRAFSWLKAPTSALTFKTFAAVGLFTDRKICEKK